MKVTFKFLTMICSAVLVFSSFIISPLALTGDNSDARMSKMIALSIGKSDAVLSGQNKKIDSTNNAVVPFIEGERTYVPVRFISEGLGENVKWIATENTVSITSSGIDIKMVVGKKEMIVNGKVVQMDAMAITKSGRVFVPVRYIAEALGKKIFYDNGLIILSPSGDTVDLTADKSMIDVLRNKTNGTSEKKTGTQATYQPPNIMGEVESITGNSANLKLIAIPQNSGNKKLESTTPKVDGRNITNQGQSRQGTNQQRTVNYTGETKVISIDPGVPITSMNRTQQGADTVKLGVQDIKVGDVLSVWLSNKVTGTISKISIITKKIQ